MNWETKEVLLNIANTKSVYNRLIQAETDRQIFDLIFEVSLDLSENFDKEFNLFNVELDKVKADLDDLKFEDKQKRENR